MTSFRREGTKRVFKVGLGKKAGDERYQYEDLLPDNLRHCNVRNPLNAEINQATVMKITAHRSVHVFQVTTSFPRRCRTTVWRKSPKQEQRKSRYNLSVTD